MKFILNYLRQELWTPYVAGILLGVVAILAVWLSHSLLGASGAFENLSGLIGKAIFPKAFDSMYFNFIMPAGISTGVILLIGVFFGGMLGAASSGTLIWRKKDAANSNRQWKRVFGPAVWKRWLLAFVGAIILEYGAGIAGGCTSGLAISGGMLLAPSAFIFIAGLFAAGIITTLILYRGRY